MDEHGVYVPNSRQINGEHVDQPAYFGFHSIPSHGESVKIRYQKEPFRDDTPKDSTVPVKRGKSYIHHGFV